MLTGAGRQLVPLFLPETYTLADSPGQTNDGLLTTWPGAATPERSRGLAPLKDGDLRHRSLDVGPERCAPAVTVKIDERVSLGTLAVEFRSESLGTEWVGVALVGRPEWADVFYFGFWNLPMRR